MKDKQVAEVMVAKARIAAGWARIVWPYLPGCSAYT